MVFIEYEGIWGNMLGYGGICGDMKPMERAARGSHMGPRVPYGPEDPSALHLLHLLHLLHIPPYPPISPHIPSSLIIYEYHL